VVRALALLVVVGIAVSLTACGGSAGSGDVVISDDALGDSLALAANRRFEDLGLFGTRVGPAGGRCQGAEATWTCTLQVQLNSPLKDLRTYAVRVDRRGCWVARQTGTDVGETGKPSRPQRPDVLRSCVR
jgi:hypothetical protein